MPKDADISVMEQMCQLSEPLSKFTDALASETRVTLSAIKPVLDHITCEILVEHNDDPSLTKEMKRVMREDLNSRYTERAKNVMKMACFIDPRFKMSFLDEPEPAIVDRCVQEALKHTCTNWGGTTKQQRPPSGIRGERLGWVVEKDLLN